MYGGPIILAVLLLPFWFGTRVLIRLLRVGSGRARVHQGAIRLLQAARLLTLMLALASLVAALAGSADWADRLATAGLAGFIALLVGNLAAAVVLFLPVSSAPTLATNAEDPARQKT